MGSWNESSVTTITISSVGLRGNRRQAITTPTNSPVANHEGADLKHGEPVTEPEQRLDGPGGALDVGVGDPLGDRTVAGMDGHEHPRTRRTGTTA
jgi:hypothetical protein